MVTFIVRGKGEGVPLSTTEPLAGSLKANVSVSPASTSDPLNAISVNAVPSSVVRDVVVVIVGASFVLLTNNKYELYVDPSLIDRLSVEPSYEIS